MKYCDFVVWLENQVHVERIVRDESFLDHNIPIATKFWRLCTLPELMGKVYTVPRGTDDPQQPACNVPLPLHGDEQ